MNRFVVVGLLLLGVGLYILRDPLTNARNWVSPEKWERSAQEAKQEQRMRGTLGGIAVVIVGLVFLAIGLVDVLS